MSNELTFVEYDVATLQARTLAQLEEGLGRVLYPGDPVRVMALAFTYIQALMAAEANQGENQNLLNFATGDVLSAMGQFVGVEKRQAEPARTTVRFTLGAPRDQVTLVPLGTRASVSGSSIYFATETAAEIPSGESHVDVIAAANVTGITGNGYLPGEINSLVDTPPFISSVSNVTPSADGSTDEDDESLRERIREAPTRFSVAGPEDAYITQTKDSRADIASVAVESPAPREINVYFTLTGGVIPAPETLSEVSEYLNDRYRRPMSDLVRVLAPHEVGYSIDLTYYILRAHAAQAGSIQDAVNRAVADWISWQRAQLGRDINPSELVHRIISAGAKRVDLRAPEYTVMPPSAISRIGVTVEQPESSEVELGQTFEGLGRANLNWLNNNTTTAALAFKADRTALLDSIATAFRYTDEEGSEYGGGAGHTGAYEIKLVTAGTNNLPSSNVLATITGYVPETYMVSDDAPMTVTFGSPVSLTEGQLYFLTIRNTSASPATNWASPNTIMTRVVPWADWVATGSGQRVCVNTGSGWAPWVSQWDKWGDGTNNGNGAYMPALFSWHDGTKSGHTYWSTAMTSPVLIYGTQYAGEQFVWGDGALALDKIGISLVRHGAPGGLTYHLEEVGGTELATGALDLSELLNSETAEWSYATLPDPVNMADGTAYRLWFAATTGDASNYYEANVPYGFSGNADFLAHMWHGVTANAQTKNGGAAWADYSPDADLSFSLIGTRISSGEDDTSTVNVIYGGMEDA
ncbi:MAG TPA: baseplate J/gp47 family protein [Armatimonadota bacterium]